jgi:multiple sugar transport system permease protein
VLGADITGAKQLGAKRRARKADRIQKAEAAQ